MSVSVMGYNVRVRRILVLGVCVLAFAAGVARGGAPAAPLPLPCGLPQAQPLWVDYADGGAVPRERARVPAAARRRGRAPVPAPLEHPVPPRHDRRCVVAAGGRGRRPRARDLLLRPCRLEAGSGEREPPTASDDAEPARAADRDRGADEPARDDADVQLDAARGRPGGAAATR